LGFSTLSGIFSLNSCQRRAQSGIRIWVWTTGKKKGFDAEWRSSTPEEQARIQSEVNELFQMLISTMKQNRNLTSTAVDEISIGRAFLGS
jgi:ClpP class serine protease